MKNNSKLLIGVLCFFIGSSHLSAQENTDSTIEWSMNVDLMSRYLWRGQELGKGPSIQPGLSGTWKDFTLGVWGAYELNPSGTQETDFYLSKTAGPLTFAIWDYWSYSDASDADFFNFSEKTTSHLLEAQILLSGGEKLPFNLLGSYFFYGADPSKSIYIELQYQRTIRNIDLTIFSGFQPKGSYYAPKAAFVNLGCSLSKTIAVTERFSLPLLMSLVVNPQTQSVHLVAGISL